MGRKITIEKWAENLEEVTIGQWRKAEGEQVSDGEVLCEIITDKVTFEYTVDTDATVARIYASEQSVVPVGYVIAYLSTANEAPEPDIEAHNQAIMTRHREKSHAELDFDLDAILGGSSPAPSALKVTPAARRLARKHQVDLQMVADAVAPDTSPLEEHHVQAYLDSLEKPQDD